jgi:hypothetical protein
MSLIVEIGTASALSEAYISVADCDTYHDNRGITLWSTLQLIEKEQAIRRAAAYMCQAYRSQWKGCRVNAVQSLDWPRYNVQLPDLGVYNVVASDTVPTLVQQANAELALLAAAGDLNPTSTQNVVSEQIGPLKVVYDASSPQGARYSAVSDILRPLLDVASRGAMVRLQRV